MNWEKDITMDAHMAKNSVCSLYVDPENSAGHVADHGHPFHWWPLRDIESVQPGRALEWPERMASPVSLLSCSRSLWRISLTHRIPELLADMERSQRLRVASETSLRLGFSHQWGSSDSSPSNPLSGPERGHNPSMSFNNHLWALS